ncbi:STAS domain-containing protein [Streptomyces argyrophyllae]|uniref:Anti-sigma factor antagonist n=1 Tax=Streptomyces argyrophylli TaxID=2726118 RepID=A0A6M4PEP1_9ACTN|nr:STAS domain-containing protein [Streptomyces argyrophyllae]QJS09167.1 STAS domain-containing protein [Streptomyces argyrophyllae]
MTDVTDTLYLTVQHPRPGLAIATVAGDVDTRTAETLRRDASMIIERGRAHLVLDLSQVGFCDSAGLSALIGLWHAAQAVGGAIRLAAVPDRLMRMLVLTGVDAILPVHATTSEAVTTMIADEPTGAGPQGSVDRMSTAGGAGAPAEGEHTACDSARTPPRT